MELALAALVACGVPSEPLPPLQEIPSPVADLSAAQVGARVQLVWSRPRLTTEGTRAQSLDRMEIFGLFLRDETELTSFPEQSRLVATAPVESASETEERTVYELPLEGPRIGATAFFAVKAVNRKGKDAGFSNMVSLTIADLPEPPSDLQATLTEKAIRLSWKPAPRSVFGGAAPPLDGYQVLRKEAGSTEAAEEIGMAPSPAYDDSSFEFEHRYVYSVRAFVKQGDSLAATPFSAPVEMAAVDRFPPAAPQNVRAIAVPGAVEMAWSPNPEPDLAGYNVYRSDGGTFAKLNPERLLIPVLRDPAVRPGAAYRYHVRASDKNGNQSDPSEEISITAE